MIFFVAFSMDYIRGFIHQIILGCVYIMMISYFYLAYHTVLKVVMLLTDSWGQ